MLLSLIVSFVLVTQLIQDSTEIQNVRLVLPPIVQAKSSATLLCLYDLEGASLYSVQWYRGQFEFFRYVPGESPSTKVFPIPGLYVDVSASSERQVTLKNIPVQISGEFSCEVTTDAPPFSASCISENLTVVDFCLHFNASETAYDFGQLLLARCSLAPFLPSIKLKFHWNKIPVPEQYVTHDSPDSAALRVNTSVLHQSGTKGQLECSAVTEDTYFVVSKSLPVTMRPKGGLASAAVKLRYRFAFSLPLIIITIIKVLY